MNTVEITDAFIRKGTSSNGGLSRKQFDILGVSYPPQKGWKKRIIGKSIRRDDAEMFLWLKDKHLETNTNSEDEKKKKGWRWRYTQDRVPLKWDILAKETGLKSWELQNYMISNNLLCKKKKRWLVTSESVNSGIATIFDKEIFINMKLLRAYMQKNSVMQ